MLAHSPRIITNGLVLCLDAANRKSYPTTGTTWTDLSGNGNTGTLVNGVGYTGSNGGALSFDGVDDYATGSIASSTSNVTMNCWIYLSSTSKKGAFVNIGTSYAIGVGSLFFESSGNEILGLFSNVRWVRTGINYGVGWKYVTFVLSATSVPSIYVNASLIGTYTGTNPNTPSNNFYIGRNIGDEPNNRAFGGEITQVSIYNRALSADEIKQNYNALKSRYGLT